MGTSSSASNSRNQDMVSYLLDTCIPIFVFRGEEKVIQWLSSIHASQIKVSSVTVMELEAGIHYATQNVEKKKLQLKTFLNLFEVIDFKSEDARQTASIMANLRTSGNMIGPYDLQIAGTALNRNFTLVSDNLKEFKRVSSLKLVNPRR